MDHPLALHLAGQARALTLDARTVEDADPELLRAFARAVLLELAALGLVAGEEALEC